MLSNEGLIEKITEIEQEADTIIDAAEVQGQELVAEARSHVNEYVSSVMASLRDQRSTEKQAQEQLTRKILKNATEEGSLMASRYLNEHKAQVPVAIDAVLKALEDLAF